MSGYTQMTSSHIADSDSRTVASNLKKKTGGRLHADDQRSAVSGYTRMTHHGSPIRQNNRFVKQCIPNVYSMHTVPLKSTAATSIIPAYEVVGWYPVASPSLA